jgi:hypothetical protein
MMIINKNQFSNLPNFSTDGGIIETRIRLYVWNELEPSSVYFKKLRQTTLSTNVRLTNSTVVYSIIISLEH